MKRYDGVMAAQTAAMPEGGVRDPSMLENLHADSSCILFFRIFYRALNGEGIKTLNWTMRSNPCSTPWAKELYSERTVQQNPYGGES